MLRPLGLGCKGTKPWKVREWIVNSRTQFGPRSAGLYAHSAKKRARKEKAPGRSLCRCYARLNEGLAVVPEGISRGMWTPDKDWRLGICAGGGMGLFIFIVPGLFGIVHLGILGTVLMAIVGFMAGPFAYSVLFLRR